MPASKNTSKTKLMSLFLLTPTFSLLININTSTGQNHDQALVFTGCIFNCFLFSLLISLLSPTVEENH